ncbi:MAG TPA: helix-turn-helix domain-containing protein [Steroidobacteraceae bacterium]
MRETRGLSLRQLAQKLGVQANSVHVAEQREARGGISLYQLQRIAAAMDCDLYYAFVPSRIRDARPSRKYAAHIRKLREQAAAADTLSPSASPVQDPCAT